MAYSLRDETRSDEAQKAWERSLGPETDEPETVTCTTCNGSGTMYGDICDDCTGEGVRDV